MQAQIQLYQNMCIPVNVTVLHLFLRSTFFAFSPLASNWFHAASMSSRFGAAYTFGSHGNIDGSTTSVGIWDGRWIWEKVCLSLELGLIL